MHDTSEDPYIQGELFAHKPDPITDDVNREAIVASREHPLGQPKVTRNMARRELYARLVAMAEEGDNIHRFVVSESSVGDLPDTIYRRTARFLRKRSGAQKQEDAHLSMELQR
jgi:hypothetical protein